MVTTWLDLAHVVGVIIKFMHNLDWLHLNAIKHVFKYLVGTEDYGILFRANKTSGIVSYTDSNFAGYLDSWKSAIGYAFKLGNGVELEEKNNSPPASTNVLPIERGSSSRLSPTPPHPTTSMEPKVSLLDKFDGTRKHFRGFIIQIKLIIQL